MAPKIGECHAHDVDTQTECDCPEYLEDKKKKGRCQDCGHRRVHHEAEDSSSEAEGGAGPAAAENVLDIRAFQSSRFRAGFQFDFEVGQIHLKSDFGTFGTLTSERRFKFGVMCPIIWRAHRITTKYLSTSSDSDITNTSMPTLTPRQQATDALHRAFLVNLISNVETEAWADDYYDSDSDSSDSDSDSDMSSSDSSWGSSSSSDSDDPTPAEAYIDAMGELYSQRYLEERRNIPKT
ncbi:hypothetical protein B0H17DRAFT_1148249 [Mycena rosella]|uniref:Uncharacterized protein n=1 Tax=Mycena rosella TaxID=1033263 RepID=A0AAD7CDB9_MYCRO|nr:hypothetical protein B0H17DRAFT_1148249 [Mycena rosella]